MSQPPIELAPHYYGMPRWRDMFTRRQLLVHGCFVEEYRKLTAEVRTAHSDDKDMADAILALLAMMQSKAIDFNSRQVSWHIARQQIRNTFAQHAFPFRSTFAEFEGGKELYRWVLDRQIVRALRGIISLVDPDSDDQKILHSTPICQTRLKFVYRKAMGETSPISQTTPKLWYAWILRTTTT